MKQQFWQTACCIRSSTNSGCNILKFTFYICYILLYYPKGSVLMLAAVIEKYGKPNVLVIREMPGRCVAK
ncbi:hypothetical protein B9T62_03175 [Paenibacillus donghaensis]|uniref:Uncharacterized protein n=1 Tax=Paenibacillus donghaensis TaxID=414771 RepID=A0A2Z2KJD8_9BACL|nr:hypothetical protein B9T62_03175 [Paenibacillus donghaensis]